MYIGSIDFCDYRVIETIGKTEAITINVLNDNPTCTIRKQCDHLSAAPNLCMCLRSLSSAVHHLAVVKYLCKEHEFLWRKPAAMDKVSHQSECFQIYSQWKFTNSNLTSRFMDI